VLIVFQLTVTHWFYLYIPWFLALFVVPLAAGAARAEGQPGPAQDDSAPAASSAAAALM
jgi:predicted secreted protein